MGIELVQNQLGQYGYDPYIQAWKSGEYNVFWPEYYMW
jgi:hypothetical protein